MSRCADPYHGARKAVTNPKCVDCDKEVISNEGSNFLLGGSGKVVHLCDNCTYIGYDLELTPYKRCITCGTGNYLKIISYEEDDEDSRIKMCESCWDLEKDGLCMNQKGQPSYDPDYYDVVYYLHYDGVYRTSPQCSRKAVYSDPPCCGSNISCLGGEFCFYVGCIHPNHPTYMEDKLCKTHHQIRSEKREKKFLKMQKQLERIEHLRYLEDLDNWEDELEIKCDEWASKYTYDTVFGMCIR